MKTYIKDVAIGTKVICQYSNSPATMLGFYGGYVVLGWEERPMEGGGTGWNRTNGNFTAMVRDITIGKEYDHINWFYWVGRSCTVEMFEQAIINPNQVCAGCNLPAPHTNPNVGDKFVCVACKFLADLDAVSANG
jgi:hypothetical protein